MYELAEHVLRETRLEGLKKLLTGIRRALAVMYSYTLCREIGECATEAAVASTLLIEAYMEGEELDIDTIPIPAHIRMHARRALEEAEDAPLRAPSSLYAQIGLDADLLARIGGLSVIYASALQRVQSLERLLAVFADALSYAYASDYIVYTRPAKKLIQVTRPHTIAMAKWLVEELALIGIDAVVKAERTAGGLVAYIDIQRCLGARASKIAIVKPSTQCTKYRLSYECSLGRIEYSICIPETTRTR